MFTCVCVCVKEEPKFKRARRKKVTTETGLSGYRDVKFIAVGLLRVVSEHNDHNSLQHDDLGQGHRITVKHRWQRRFWGDGRTHFLRYTLDKRLTTARDRRQRHGGNGAVSQSETAKGHFQQDGGQSKALDGQSDGASVTTRKYTKSHVSLRQCSWVPTVTPVAGAGDLRP